MTQSPKSTTEALGVIDDMLASLTPRYSIALARLADACPGHSGRPAGNGEPGGAPTAWVAWDGTTKGGWSVSVVERAVRSGRGVRQRQARLETLPALCVSACDELAGSLGIRAIDMPPKRSSAMQLSWCGWVTRLCHEYARQYRKRPSQTETLLLFRLVDEMLREVDQWTTPPVVTERSETALLATDNTGTWCRRCLAAGHRAIRSDKYPATGACRWCGDFHATHGWWPTDVLVDAHHEGRNVAPLIEAERPSKQGAKRRRR